MIFNKELTNDVLEQIVNNGQPDLDAKTVATLIYGTEVDEHQINDVQAQIYYLLDDVLVAITCVDPATQEAKAFRPTMKAYKRTKFSTTLKTGTGRV